MRPLPTTHSLFAVWVVLFCGGNDTSGAAFVSPLYRGPDLPTFSTAKRRRAAAPSVPLQTRIARCRGGSGGDGTCGTPSAQDGPIVGMARKDAEEVPSSPSTTRPELLPPPSRKIIGDLKALYKESVLPVERRFQLHSFCLPTDGEIQDAEFDARPMVLLIGQYSTGKTTFIRHLLGGDFPGMHIGPEPTTANFMALIHGEEEEDERGVHEERDDDTAHLSSSKDESYQLVATDDVNIEAMPAEGDLVSSEGNGPNNNARGKIIKGNSLTVTPELPFSSLSQFGSAFLNHFVGSVTPAPLLRDVTLIDTPGVLSGEKQRLNRSYDFAQTVKWFADRSDLILLLFDADKLDVSDELKAVVETIRVHNDDKIRCILNKADGVSREELVRVYGSLMWSMGKLFRSPEVVRVYAGSFWDRPLVNDDFRSMFEADESLLIQELRGLPLCAAERKVNQMVKRIRLVKVHVCILSYLRQHRPRLLGKERGRKRLIAGLHDVFVKVRNKYDLPVGDMPDEEEFASCLEGFSDFAVFPKADRKLLRSLDDLIERDIPRIMKGTVGVTYGREVEIRQ